MAKYCIEKFESDSGAERTVCWRQDKHIHDAGFIVDIEVKLQIRFGGTWQVRANSYRSNQSSCGTNALKYEDL